MVQEGGREVARKCRCLSPERIQKLLGRSGLPARFWTRSLNKMQTRSLFEISFVDYLKDTLNEGVRHWHPHYHWIVSGRKLDVNAILSCFASDLMQMAGYSCSWLALPLDKRFPWMGSEAREADFLLLVNFQAGLLRARERRWLEETLWTRLGHRQSTIISSPGLPNSPDFKELFLNQKLIAALTKHFEVFEPGRNTARFRQAGWLF